MSAIVNMLTLKLGVMHYQRKVPHKCSKCGHKLRLYSARDIFPLTEGCLLYVKSACVCNKCKTRSYWADLSESKNRKESIKRMSEPEHMKPFDGTEVFEDV